MVMKFFRKKKNRRIILWVIAILIIPGFVLWGVGGAVRRRSHDNLSAKVNKESITLREFYSAYEKADSQYRKIFGDKYNDAVKQMDLERNMLEQLIREKLLLQEAKKRHLRVFDKEIVSVTKSDPVFKGEDGKFDQNKFTAIIKNMPPAELRAIEADVKKGILLQKLRQQVVSKENIVISDKEVDDYIDKNKLRLKEVDRELIQKMLLSQKQAKYFNDWYDKMRQSSDISIYVDFKKKQLP